MTHYSVQTISLYIILFTVYLHHRKPRVTLFRCIFNALLSLTFLILLYMFFIMLSVWTNTRWIYSLDIVTRRVTCIDRPNSYFDISYVYILAKLFFCTTATDRWLFAKWNYIYIIRLRCMLLCIPLRIVERASSALCTAWRREHSEGYGRHFNRVEFSVVQQLYNSSRCTVSCSSVWTLNTSWMTFSTSVGG